MGLADPILSKNQKNDITKFWPTDFFVYYFLLFEKKKKEKKIRNKTKQNYINNQNQVYSIYGYL